MNFKELEELRIKLDKYECQVLQYRLRYSRLKLEMDFRSAYEVMVIRDMYTVCDRMMYKLSHLKAEFGAAYNQLKISLMEISRSAGAIQQQANDSLIELSELRRN